MELVTRAAYEQQVTAAMAAAPVVALLGPRQCGKTTLARRLSEGWRQHSEVTFLDLEDPRDAARLTEPMLALERLRGLVIIDEAQLRPDLFAVLRVLADRPGQPAGFLLLGSAAPHLVRGASESLAGRVRFVDMAGFDLAEVGPGQAQRLWQRGGFPRSFLAESDEDSLAWRIDFVRTFLTRDLAQLGPGLNPQQMRRFWTMLAHYHGQTWNASTIATSLGLSYKTTQSYVDLLAGAYMVRCLQPWAENVGKRVRKAPKVYLTDTGLLHALLGLSSQADLESHPALGASWEGFALAQVLRAGRWSEGEVYYWATHAGAEIDLLVTAAGRRYGIEFKYAQAPRVTKSMRMAQEALGLAKVIVVHPGAGGYPLAPDVEALGLEDVALLPSMLKSGGASDVDMPS